MEDGAPNSCCPTCGAAYTRERPTVDLDRNIFLCAAGSIRVTPSQAEILYVLAKHHPRGARHDEIAAAVYGAGEGPEDERTVLRVHMLKVRRALAPPGWTITTNWHAGYRLVSPPVAT